MSLTFILLVSLFLALATSVIALLVGILERSAPELDEDLE